MDLLDTRLTTTVLMSSFADFERFFSLDCEEFWVPMTQGRCRVEKLIDAARARGFGVFHLNGARMQSQSDLFLEFKEVLRFPDYFGENWNALDECLADLEWLDLRGYLLVIEYGDLVLCREKIEVRNMLKELLRDISREWASATPPVLFRTVQVVD
jgi:RNAse (barnase) inhibitor barstar